MSEVSPGPQDQAQINQDCASALVASLVATGLLGVVISPGSRNTPLVLAAADHPHLRTWSVLDERSAGFFALGMARAKQAPVAVLCTSGSAGANYLPSVVEAKYSNVPLVVLTADRPEELHHCGAPQTMDQDHLFGVFVADHQTLEAPHPGCSVMPWVEAGRHTMERAWGSPLQPVHLNVAFREPLWRESLRPPIPPRPSEALPVRRPARLDAHVVEGLARELSSVERGLIYCGPHRHVHPELGMGMSRLAKVLGWPLLCEAASGLRYGPVAPHEQICAYDALFKTEFGLGHRPAYVLRFGGVPTVRRVAEYLAHSAIESTTIIADDGRLYDPHDRASRVVHAHYLPLVKSLCAELDASAALGPWLADWQAAESRAEGTIAEGLSTSTLWEGSAVRTIMDHLPAGVGVHVANSAAIRDVDTFCRATGRPHRLFTSRGMNGIDGTLSTAAGEAAMHGPLVCILGDLAFLHDSNGLMLAAQHGLTIALIDNGGGGIFNGLPISAHPQHYQRYFLTPQRVRWSSLCEAFGVDYVPIESQRTLRTHMENLSSDTPAQVLHILVRSGHNRIEQGHLDEAVGRLFGGAA